MKVDGIVIGGGPAGMFAAVTAASRGCHVLLLEKNDRLGKKLLITGKGRCNVTNRCTEQEVLQNTPRNGRFLYSAMTAFPPEKTIAFFEEHGCPLKTERGNRVFPVT
ncbi:MAG: NAD(P)/FAD-dependent oxidoreductase, partial [Clostridiales bacterium]|nr:NAD(P)/FAD-dependent oxidoreductase [Clostridiales bacterium]